MFIMSGEAFEPNDLTDAEHSAMALPYCDTFFCDSALAHKLKANPLRLDLGYTTKVINAPDDFLNMISQL